MQRQMSLFELQPSFRREVELGKGSVVHSSRGFFLMASLPMGLGIDRDGCSLSGVSAKVHWEERKVSGKLDVAWRTPEEEEEEEDGGGGLSSQDEEEEEEGAAAAAVSQQQRRPEGADELWPIRRLHKGAHLTLNMESASLLPVVLR